MDTLSSSVPTWVASSLVAVVIAVPIYCFLFSNRIPRSPPPSGPPPHMPDQTCSGLEESKEGVYANVLVDLDFPDDEIATMLGNPLSLCIALAPPPLLLYAKLSLVIRFTRAHQVLGGCLLGEMCTSLLGRVGQVEALLTSQNQISEEQFEMMIRHVHSVVGGAAMLGLETLSNAARDLKHTMKQAKQTSSIGEVTTQLVPETALSNQVCQLTGPFHVLLL